jgi:hypothetical protein
MVALTADDSPALGNIWQITAKKTDFYLDAYNRDGSLAHVSIHGSNARFDGHRFHIKIDRQLAAVAKDRGYFVKHNIPRKGFAFDGHELATRTFCVARIRWTWDLQRPRFREAAVSSPPPELDDHQAGARLSKVLQPNEAWDIDLVVSYDKPFWPDSRGSLRDKARLGPLRNDAGLWLTATSYHRSQREYPAPEGLRPRLPRPDEDPNRMMCGGLGSNGTSDMYWFLETITSRQLIEQDLDEHDGEG